MKSFDFRMEVKLMGLNTLLKVVVSITVFFVIVSINVK